ncbi:MAG: T9SS type A sorting domain-containing protein [Candidatus Kapabacteria bacterium]|nr:T9SS type A sorting domain-containing protein [Candidatus Kapabacteria bacterium]
MTSAPHRPFIRSAAIALLLCLCSVTAMAQFTLPDTLRLRVGERKTIDVAGVLDVPDGSEVRLEFTFTPSTARPISGAGSALDGFRCANVPVAQLSMQGPRVGTFGLWCDSAQRTSGGRICELTLEGLASGDTVGSFRIQGLTVDGVFQPLEDGPNMTVLLEASTFIETRTFEGFVGNFPNPFSMSTRIEYVVTEAGLVSMDIVDLAGRLFHTFETKQHEPGTYSVEFRPDIWEMSSGHYLLRMKTDRGTYLHTMTVEK